MLGTGNNNIYVCIYYIWINVANSVKYANVSWNGSPLMIRYVIWYILEICFVTEYKLTTILAQI